MLGQVAANAGESDDAPALLQKAAVKLYKNDATVQALLKADGLDLEELDTIEVTESARARSIFSSKQVQKTR